MINIYLTRHGETLWNKEHRLQGWKDSELTEAGTRNAIDLGKRLYQTDLNAIYSSPITRAVKTTKLISSDRSIPIVLDDGLKELNFGEWEGKTKEEIEKNFQDEYFNLFHAPHIYNHERHKGESLEDLKQRVEHSLKKIINTNAGGNVLIVTHGITIRAILAYLMNISIEKWMELPLVYGTSLSMFKFDGKIFQLNILGDTSHLQRD